MSARLKLEPRLGDAIMNLIERITGESVHIALIVCPMEGAKLGQPEFITSLQPKEMENLIIQVAGNFALVGDPVVKGSKQ